MTRGFTFSCRFAWSSRGRGLTAEDAREQVRTEAEEDAMLYVRRLAARAPKLRLLIEPSAD
jgi:hypothetical protein